jgi:polysaccharide biosynthesis/export protein
MAAKEYLVALLSIIIHVKLMKKAFCLVVVIVSLSSCGILNQSIMFKTDPGYTFAPTPDYKQITEYKVSANDVLVFDMYTNDGSKLINFTSSFASSQSSSSTTTVATAATQNEYLVDADGFVKLPLIGRQKIADLTVREVEVFLEGKYADFYLKPFIVAKITNRNVILFPGNTGDAKIIKLTNQNTTLIELLAQEGGISINGKARKVKLIRDINQKHEVYLIDLSTIAGIDDAHIVLQANDIVYVEPRRRVSYVALKELTPLLSIISTTLLSIAALNALLK